jgi:hypothetical protein
MSSAMPRSIAGLLPGFGIGNSADAISRERSGRLTTGFRSRRGSAPRPSSSDLPRFAEAPPEPRRRQRSALWRIVIGRRRANPIRRWPGASRP